MSEWQPIETAPKDGTKILVYTIHGDIEISEWYTVNRYHYEPVEGDLYRRIEAKRTGGWNSNNFEWWMPLPEPPK
ncbi:MAG: hypothetical protein KGL39_38760 [Patescibacteria group bacterium]|nr:hypothetical protein [Patescibacteria group bacterium]